ncbi:MAG: 5-formyltetrahydrofolate cyclo-ligase [Oscillospiraceae bacterium]|jgi:5-formyltetrahydrofolate cyclo-ligase|nr:5-formyltetrahydrofolate cyclo-ligase [Oscillospiraceae bacterium]
MCEKITWDIREYKNSLRKKYKELRLNMPYDEKEKRDSQIFNKVISLKVFKEAPIVLTYVSTEIEVDTKRLINYCFENAKPVAVPRCVPGTSEMFFYKISSMDDLEKGTFSVLEPKPDRCEKISDARGAICIVPGLAFDSEGYRLGYGKGYYDRYLSRQNDLKKIGICYCSCTVNNLARGRFDVPVDILVTEKYIKIVKNEKPQKEWSPK